MVTNSSCAHFLRTPSDESGQSDKPTAEERKEGPIQVRKVTLLQSVKSSVGRQ
jgi:hypothetical protein